MGDWLAPRLELDAADARTAVLTLAAGPRGFQALDELQLHQH